MPTPDLERRSINALRILAIDAVQQAGSGHPGLPMGMADAAYVLWTRHLRHNPKDPAWPNRDRFILSAGHGSALLYSLLYLTGYPLSLGDLKQFRQWSSRTPGHPEVNVDLGVETTTGPLGQGFGIAIGMAIAARHLAARFNREGYPIFDHWIYTIISDGDVMEGVTHEAASLAGHQGIGKLIALYDDNDITIDGSTNLTFTEDVGRRFEACGWRVQVVNGHDTTAVDTAIRRAKRTTDRPHLIICRTHIGYGSPNVQDSARAHGGPLGEAEVHATKEALDWPSQEPFFVPNDVIAQYRLAIPQGERAEAIWHDQLTNYTRAHPEEALELNRVLAGDLPANWEVALPKFAPSDGAVATRTASGQTLQALAPVIPELIGGSADLAHSTRTSVAGYGDFGPTTPEGRNIHFGVREHGMGALLNGMALHGGVRPFGGTFLVFSDYMRPAVRLAALMRLPVTYIWTHDSVFVGEDGPTHQPVEHLLSLRAIPNLTVIRPADANETVAAWRVALERRQSPVALILSRQRLPVLKQTAQLAPEGVARGAYVLSKSPFERVDLVIIATGSEVADALDAQKLLADRQIGARVVSMPSWKLFEEQPIFYRLNVLPESVTKRLAVEAGSPLGWERYVGSYGHAMGVDHFGASAPYDRLKTELGFTPERIADRAQRLLAE